MPPESRHRLSLQFLLVALASLLTLLVAFGAAETAARVFRPAPPKSQSYPWNLDRLEGYEFKPYAVYKGEQLNSEGFRSRDIPLLKRHDEFRILAVGDSTCFSLNVARSDSWSDILQQTLNSSSIQSKMEVINAGVPGYASYQALARLKARGLRYRPDLVIALVGWNDLGMSTFAEWKPYTDFAKLSIGLLEFRIDTIGHSRLIALFYSRLRRLQHAHLEPMTTRKDSGAPFNEKALQVYMDSLEGMREVSVSNGARFSVVIWPTLLDVSPRPPDLDQKLKNYSIYYPLSLRELKSWYERYIAAIRLFARGHPDVILLDPTKAFTSSPLKGDLFIDNAHLTPDGNRLLAKEIARTLGENGIVTDSRAPRAH